jgi:tetratricopeptide (TPR) repeat protein
MPAPEQLVEVWAQAADGRGKCGSGWVVGQSGVITCRHVLDRYLADPGDDSRGFKGSDGQARIQVRRAAASSESAWVDCAIVWQHPARDLVLLQITPQAGQSWTPKGRLSRLAGTGQRPSKCTAMGFPDAVERPTGLRDSDQALGTLLPAGAARDPDGLVPFDVDISVPGDAALWEGFSGSAVVDERTRLVGLVVGAHPARQQRRLLVVPVENAESGPGFPAAAAVVGLDPTVEDYQAPSWRQGVEPQALTASGLPPVVADIEDLRIFGVHVPSSKAGHDSQIGYVNRDKDYMLDAALAEARSGGRRFVLVTGDSAAGKSRSASEALHRDEALCGWRLIVPLPDGGLAHLAKADLGWQDTVLWLDDLDKYLAHGLDLGTVRRILGDDPTVVVVATMQTRQLQARQSQLRDPAWEFLTDDPEVTRVDLEVPFSEDELERASTEISDARLRSALQEGVGLGEWLVAGPELTKRLNDAKELDRAFADTVIAWYRTGLDQPLAREDAERLWASALSPGLRQRLLKRRPSEQRKLFELADAWACEPFISRDLYEQALIGKEDGGYVAHDYVVDQIVRNPQRPPVPGPVWEHALQTAASEPDSEQRSRRTWTVGIAASDEDALTQAMTAMRTLADAGNSEALFNVAVLSGKLGRPDEEIEAYDQVVARFGYINVPPLREQVAAALYGKGVTLGELGRSEEAVGVYDQLVAWFGGAAELAVREQVANALVNKGVMLGELGRSEEAVGVYDQVVARFGDDADLTQPALREQVARALLYKGIRLGELGRSEEAVGVFGEVVARFGDAAELAVREQVARALANKGLRLGQLNRPEEEIEAYDQAVERFGEAAELAVRAQVARALLYKGIRLGQLGRFEEAVGVFDEVVARFGEAAELAVREQVANALVIRGAALGRLVRGEDGAGGL